MTEKDKAHTLHPRVLEKTALGQILKGKIPKKINTSNMWTLIH